MLEFEEELTDPGRMSERVAFHGHLMAEEDAANAICDRLLTGPWRWWRNALDEVDGARTAGMVAVLIARSEKAVPRTPAEGLELADIAAGIAEKMAMDAYPYDHVAKVRGQALRQKAYALVYMGRHHEAVAAAELAAASLQQIPVAPLELARLDMARSEIARRMEKFEEAIGFARRAGETFLEFGSRGSWLKARQFEACARYSQGRFAEARDIWRTCEAYFERLEPGSRAAVLYNLAVCAFECGDRDESARYFARAAVAFDELQFRVPRAKCRYGEGRALLAAGAYEQAILLLQDCWQELEELEALGDAVLPALLLAEALLIVGRPEEVPAICRMLIDRCTRAEMPSGALTALAFLRETLAAGKTVPALVRYIHDYMRDTACGANGAFEAEQLTRCIS